MDFGMDLWSLVQLLDTKKVFGSQHRSVSDCGVQTLIVLTYRHRPELQLFSYRSLMSLVRYFFVIVAGGGGGFWLGVNQPKPFIWSNSSVHHSEKGNLNNKQPTIEKRHKISISPRRAAQLLKGAFSLHRASGPPPTRDSRRTSYPLKWSEKASSGTPRTRDRLSPRDKMSTTSDSATNQIVFHGVPSNVHSFPVSY